MESKLRQLIWLLISIGILSAGLEAQITYLPPQGGASGGAVGGASNLIAPGATVCDVSAGVVGDCSATSAGTFGDSTHVPQLIFNGTRVTGVTNVGITGTGGPGTPPYVTTTITASPMTILASTHAQGAVAVPICWDTSTPRVELACSFTRNSSGDLVLTYTSPTPGEVDVFGSTGGFPNPMTTSGDTLYENATPVPARLAGNSTGTLNVLTMTSSVPAWSTLAAANITTGGPYLPLAGGTLTGNLLFSADNSLDIGATGATRPRDLFLGRNATISGTLTPASITWNGSVQIADAANAISQRNGANNQSYFAYQTFTDASNYRRTGLGIDGKVSYQCVGTGCATQDFLFESQITNGNILLSTNGAGSIVLSTSSTSVGNQRDTWFSRKNAGQISADTSGSGNNGLGSWIGAGHISVGTKFTTSGCSVSATTGGATAGTFTSGTTGTCTVVITMNGATGLTAPNGWACQANDRTTFASFANDFQQTTSSTTTATVQATTVSGDVVSFYCMGY